MAIRKKLGTKTVQPKVVEEVVEEVMEDVVDDVIGDLEPEEIFEEDLDFDDVEELEDMEEEVEEEEVEIVKPVKKATPKKQAKPVAKQAAKPAPKKETVAKQSTNGKKSILKLKEKEDPYNAIVPGKVTKRDDVMKIAISKLEELSDSTITLEGMNLIFKCIEHAMETSLNEGAPVTLLGNQVAIRERKAKPSNVPGKDYDTLTYGYTAYVWSKLGDREVVRGHYDKDSKVFTTLEGEEIDTTNL